MLYQRSKLKGYKKRKKKKKRTKSFLRRQRFWLRLLLLIAVGGGVYVVLFSPALEIERIKLPQSGEENFKKFLESKKGENIFLVNLNDIEDSILKSCPIIYEANIKRKLPSTLSLSVKRREPAIRLCYKKQLLCNDCKTRCFFIDKKGVVFSRPEKSSLVKVFMESENLPIPGDIALSENTVHSLVQIKEGIERSEDIGVEKMTLKGERVNAFTSEGWEVYFDISKDVQTKIMKLRALLDKKISLKERKNLNYIDLRFSKVYYK